MVKTVENVYMFQENGKKPIQLNTSVWKDIRRFLDQSALNSPNTATSYKADIRQFFQKVRNKDLEMLTLEDIILTAEEVDDYQLFLHNGMNYAASSVSRKISPLRSLYKDLSRKYPVKQEWFNVKKIKGTVRSSGFLEWGTVEKMMELVKDTRKGKVKALLMETAVKTSFRQNELLSLAWENIEVREGESYVVASIMAKGKKIDEKPINRDLYNRLLATKEEGESRVFPVTKKTVCQMMISLREQLGLDENTTFHSLKNCGINEVYEITGGDFMATAEQGNHNSFSTTMKHYMKRKKDFGNMACLQIGEKLDLSPLEQMSKEELMNLIIESSRSLQMELLNKAQKGK